MTDDDYVEDPWGAPAHMSQGWTGQGLSRAPQVQHVRRTTRRKTSGVVKRGGPTFVYAASNGHMCKVGITCDPPRRQRQLGAKITLAIPVFWEAAREVEEVALGYLGRSDLLPDEWVRTDAAAAEAAVRRAWDAVGRYRHVDPDLTAEQARMLRIGLAQRNGV